MKEPEIKLFGRKIHLPENTGEVSIGDCSDGISDQDRVFQAEEDNRDPNETEESQNLDEPFREESGENPKTPSIEEDNPKSCEAEQSNSPNQKALKKPDKILPCPRCNSMDTKFCYYNNYNINQPRHFCRGCQRYWTAGGTMRNVPVGSGRRKNKNLTSNSHHITLNEALQAPRIVDAAHNGFYHHQSFRPNGVLSFGPDSKLCEPMPSGSNPTDKRAVNNGFSTGDQVGSVSCNNKDHCSLGSSSLANGFTSHVPYVPWPLPWNGYPVPTFYPQPYWNCGWNIPWLPVPNQKTPPNSYPLGKHSRNGELLNPNSLECKEYGENKILESSIVVPKTLRIDDPEEAAKSSIWETLGIKYDSAQREGLFKAFQPKCDGKKPMVSNSSVLQANPAALSRSITFQEGV